MKKLSLILVGLILFGCAKDKEAEEPAFSDKQIEAATNTANFNSYCTGLTDFYWEIGNKDGVITSGVTGNKSVTGSTTLSIASASKWIFGAYVVQAQNGVVSGNEIKYLTMSSGYTSFGNFSCVPNSIQTVQACFDAANNSEYTAENDNLFYYNGGHFQRLALDLGLGPMNESELATEVKSKLGFNLSYTSPQLAGGVNTSGIEYGKFLRRVLSGELLMNAFLGASAVCADPENCESAVYSPIYENLKYSLGHWVETDSAAGDGSFSSAGLFGFYPWIDATKTYYGIISRYEVPDVDDDIGSGYESLLCGRQIRKAFMTGQEQY